MSTSGRFPTHHIPDDGTRYAPEQRVRIDQSSGQVRIVKDPEGDYEVMGCRPATEYGSAPPLLRVDLRKREATANADTEPWTPGGPSRW
jgi:hypothetical protein